MAETYFPFDSGPGSALSEANWYDMATAWQSSGVKLGDGSQLAVSASSGMTINVGTGAAWVFGGFYRNSAAKPLTVGANSSGNPRIDTVVLTLDLTGNTIIASIHAGTPAGSPAAPALSAFEFPLCDIAVANGAANIVSGNLTLRRQWYQTESALTYSPTYTPGAGAPWTVTPIAGNPYPDNNNNQFRILPGNLCWFNINQLMTFAGSSSQQPLFVSLPMPPRYLTELPLGVDNAPGYGAINPAVPAIEMYPQQYVINGGLNGAWAMGNFWVRATGVYQIAAG